jgi:hypothetical protein
MSSFVMKYKCRCGVELKPAGRAEWCSHNWRELYYTHNTVKFGTGAQHLSPVFVQLKQLDRSGNEWQAELRVSRNLVSSL